MMYVFRKTFSIFNHNYAWIFKQINAFGLYTLPMCRKYSYEINVFPALSDNYMYLLTDNDTKVFFCCHVSIQHFVCFQFCAAVDPVEPDDISKYIRSNDLNLTHILITHHHWDHSSGTANLQSQFRDNLIKVVGFDERIEGLNYRVTHEQSISIGNLSVKCLFTPCHTRGHMSYFVSDKQNKKFALFTGDTIFVAGCGKFFEGTAADMHKCIETIKSLPLKTLFYCGHEYTLKNLEFALSIDGQNREIADKLAWAREQRKQNQPTVPTSLESEIQTNPFFQANNEHYKSVTGESNPVSVIKILRKMKDEFK